MTTPTWRPGLTLEDRRGGTLRLDSQEYTAATLQRVVKMGRGYTAATQMWSAMLPNTPLKDQGRLRRRVVTRGRSSPDGRPEPTTLRAALTGRARSRPGRPVR